MKTIGENLKIIRKELNLTQKEFAEKIGYSYQLVGSWEHNRCFPTVHTLKKIHEIFGIDYDEIFDFDV